MITDGDMSTLELKDFRGLEVKLRWGVKVPTDWRGLESLINLLRNLESATRKRIPPRRMKG